MDKSVLRDAILQQLRDELARQSTAAELARDEAISEESQPENKWDTHSQEAAYLAEGQAKQVAEIRGNIEAYAALPLPPFGPGDLIALGAVVGVEAEPDARPAWYFLGPRAGGVEVVADGRSILVVTPQSPLGRQLIGRRVGDTVQSAGRGGTTKQRVVSVE